MCSLHSRMGPVCLSEWTPGLQLCPIPTRLPQLGPTLTAQYQRNQTHHQCNIFQNLQFCEYNRNILHLSEMIFLDKKINILIKPSK